MRFAHVLRVLYLLSFVAVTHRIGAQSDSTKLARGTAASAVSGVTSGVVAPGDRIYLHVLREPEWSDSLLVSAEGEIALPRTGRFHAAGFTPAAVRDSIQGRLAAYLRDPSVDLVLMRRVVVLGAVKKADVYYVDPSATLRDVLARAGGFTDDADPNRVEIVRGGQHTRLGKWDAVAESALPIASGDQVFVGKRGWFSRNAVATVSSVAVAVSVLLTAIRR